MSSSSFLDPQLYDYVCRVSVQETAEQRALREETQRMSSDLAIMQVGPDQARFMQFLVRLIEAKMCLEVGVFTGYSALSVALALPTEGRIIACDVSEEYAAVALRYWNQAGVAAKIDLRVRPATGTLDSLLSEGRAGSFDFAFIDADKTSYDAYYERCLKLVRAGGLIAIDNVFWSGRVADANNREESTQALRGLNAKVSADQRVDAAMVPIADGLTLARVR
ncbi:MAG: class I SAM-dependent methyltransferase [Candidatus Eremiobacteraeota bacterium]|nr:class I SAM-dependent methyltransferase [Candidatus Eremiobacteraeota bacterium]MBC5828072.1 class I SAM-dependent methyltransferase [Candidatus Eremiobacteraeota bacterium]